MITISKVAWIGESRWMLFAKTQGVNLKKTNKSRILYILKPLYDETDEQNLLSTENIINYLADLNIRAHRKTIVADMKLLEEFGIDVITIKSTQNKYFIGNRDFELPEVKLLFDAVESSKFITKKKSEELAKKLSKLVSSNQAIELYRNIYIDRRVKPENEEIYYIVDTIHTAISKNQQVEFKYYEFTQEKEKVYKNEGYIYELSPYALSWSEDYYVGCYYNYLACEIRVRFYITKL